MNNLTRKDGTKEKQAELTASRIHHITLSEDNSTKRDAEPINRNSKEAMNNNTNNNSNDTTNGLSNEPWNSSPLVPEIDEIPF